MSRKVKHVIMRINVSGIQKSSGAPETTPTSGALRAPPFGVVSGAPGPVQTAQIDDSWVPENNFSFLYSYEVGLIRPICVPYRPRPKCGSGPAPPLSHFWRLIRHGAASRIGRNIRPGRP